MKVKSFILAGIMLASGALPAVAGHVLTINGVAVDKAVATITFDGETAVLTFSDNTSSTHDIEHVAIDFAQGGQTAIDDIAFGSLSVEVGASVKISGTTPGAMVDIIDMQGRCVKTAVAHDNVLEIGLDGTAAGVYLLRTGNTIVKFVKR